jgi:hypothetical protein
MLSAWQGLLMKGRARSKGLTEGELKIARQLVGLTGLEALESDRMQNLANALPRHPRSRTLRTYGRTFGLLLLGAQSSISQRICSVSSRYDERRASFQQSLRGVSRHVLYLSSRSYPADGVNELCTPNVRYRLRYCIFGEIHVSAYKDAVILIPYLQLVCITFLAKHEQEGGKLCVYI